MHTVGMPTILVVDDSAQDRKPLAKLLKVHGYDVLAASNAYEAMAAAKRQQPDLIVLDVMLPPVDGLTFLMLLRQDGTGANIPVIVLTGLDDQNTVSRAENLGVKEILIKAEFDPCRLLELIDKHLKTEIQSVPLSPPPTV